MSRMKSLPGVVGVVSGIAESSVARLDGRKSVKIPWRGATGGLTVGRGQRIVSAMRTTLTLDDDVYEAARARARATGKRLGRVLSEMARESLQSSRPRPRPPAKKTARFPVFEVPEGTPMISASQGQRALDEDGIGGDQPPPAGRQRPRGVGLAEPPVSYCSPKAPREATESSLGDVRSDPTWFRPPVLKPGDRQGAQESG